MAKKFLTDINIAGGVYDSSGDIGNSGQVLSSTGSGVNWINATSSASIIYQDGFTGDGSTTAFTLANSLDNENKTQVYIDGVYQHKDNYSLSGTTLTFSTAPPNSSDIEVISFSSVSSADDILYDDDFSSAGLMTTNGSGVYSITTNNSSNWNTAYTYSQVGHLPLAGGAITGAITTNSTFDGRDVSVDGTKLDGIEANATADQTDAEIRAAVEAATDSNVFTDADHTKLNAIEASADVTDTANVTAAGALMDSEVTNLADVKAFDTTDYATAAQGTLADSAQQPPSEGAFANGDKTKLDGIEASADVTDTTNVTADGALMDSELTDLAGIKAVTISDLATETYVDTAVSDLVDSSPATLNTLNELAAALGDDPNFATTTANSIGTKLPLAGGTMTGTLTIADSDASDNPLILGSSSQTSYTLQQWQTSSHGTNEAYIIAYGAGHGSQAGNFAMKNIESGGDIFFELASSVVPLRMTSTGSTFAGRITGQNGITVTGGATGADIYINNTSPTLGFTDSNSFTDANDIYIVRGTSNDSLEFKWYDDSAGTTERTFVIDNAGNATFAGDVDVDGGNLKINPSSSTHNSSIELKGYEPSLKIIKTRGTGGDDIFQINHENDTSAIDFNLTQDGGSAVRTARITDNNRWVIGGHAEVNSSQLSVQGTFGITGNATFGGTISAGDGTQAVNSDADLTLRNGNSFVGVDLKSARTSGNIGGLRYYGTGSDSVAVAQFLVETDGSYHFYNGTNGAQSRFTINSTGSATFGNGISTTDGNLEINALDGGGSPAMTSQFTMKGYEGRGIGIKMKDNVHSASGSSDREWFVGSGYNTSNFNIGYSATGSQSSYPAQAMLNISTNGNVFATASLRAPIFYDTDNTSYYINPAANSELSTATFTLNANSTISLVAAGTNASQIKAGAGDELYLGGNNTWQMRLSGGNILMDNGGYALSNGSMRAPIFYDSNNTSYYTNPAGDSVMNQIHINDYIRHNGDLDTYMGFNGSNSWKLHVGGGDRLIATTSQFTSNLNVAAPIFYDKDDTSYYTHPGNTSNLNALNIQSGNIDLRYAHTVDMTGSGYNQSTYYPVRIFVSDITRIRIENRLNAGGTHPTWASHGSGFSLLMDWYTNGSGWGTVGVTRTIRQWNEAWASATICGGITQMSHSSQEVVWLRGGGTYKIRTSFNNTVAVQTSAYTSNGQTVTPTTSIVNDVYSAASGSFSAGGNVYAGSSYATIFYDRDDTTYYGNFGSTGTSLKVRGTAEFSTSAGNLRGYIRATDTNNEHFIIATSGGEDIAFKDGGTSGQVNMIIRGDGDVLTTRNHYAKTFYDIDNSSYYINAADTSVIQGLTMAGALQTAGSATIGSSGTSNIYMGGTSGNHFRFHVHAGTTYFDMNSGTINWRQGSSTRYYFYPSTANMTINGTLTQNSDIRTKENIVEIPNALEKINAMRGVYYNRTDLNTGVTKVGVIAQEVEAVLPELILEAPDTGLKSVAYAELTAILINGIKELEARVKELENK